jgi:hypothetical protein
MLLEVPVSRNNFAVLMKTTQFDILQDVRDYWDGRLEEGFPTFRTKTLIDLLFIVPITIERTIAILILLEPLLDAPVTVKLKAAVLTAGHRLP